MTGTHIQWSRCVMLTIIAVSAFSCAHADPGKKETAVSGADHEKIMERYRKGVEESKIIVIARVNGSDITMNHLINTLNQIAPMYIKNPRERTPEIDRKLKKEALDLLIFRELAVQEAIRRGMKVESKNVEQSLKTFTHIMGSEEAYNSYLSQRGLTDESMKKEIERDELFKMIADEEIIQKAKGNEDKAQAVQKRKQEWEAELREGAKIEITLDEVEKQLKEETGNKKRP